MMKFIINLFISTKFCSCIIYDASESVIVQLTLVYNRLIHSKAMEKSLVVHISTRLTLSLNVKGVTGQLRIIILNSTIT